MIHNGVKKTIGTVLAIGVLGSMLTLPASAVKGETTGARSWSDNTNDIRGNIRDTSDDGHFVRGDYIVTGLSNTQNLTNKNGPFTELRKNYSGKITSTRACRSNSWTPMTCGAWNNGSW